jgi:hypothetical protein
MQWEQAKKVVNGEYIAYGKNPVHIDLYGAHHKTWDGNKKYGL